MTFEGRPLEAPVAARVQSLLAYLLLHADAPQSRAQLSFTFWPDASEANARNNLRQLLHQLRQTLTQADRYLRTDASSVQWVPDPTTTLDVVSFERAIVDAEKAARAGDIERRRTSLERAVGLCQGALLPSFYDDWIAPRRENLVQRCKEAVAGLVSLLEEQREYPEALRHVRHWLQHDSLEEEAHRWLMRLLALSGDRAGALQAYRHCADTLQRELGVEPSAATVRLHERIRDAEAEPSPSRAGGETSPPAASLVG